MTAAQFVWSDQKQTIVVWTAAAPTIAAVVVAFVVLLFAGLIYANPRTRGSLRRQSLQMLLCVQLASLVYSATYLGEMLITGPTPWCNACIILTLFTSNFIDFVIMLIPVNLQLALVHGIRTEGWVRWYLSGSLLAASVTAVPGAVEDVWGWDPLSRICWIKTPDPALRNAWQLGAFYAWILFSMLVATVSTVVVIVHLVVYMRAHDRKCAGTRSTASSNGHIVRAVAWRITLYPLILISANCVSAAANFTITARDGIAAQPTFVVWAASGFFYGAMPLFCGLVALFVDPSFSRTVRGLVAPRTPRGTSRPSGIELGAGGASALQIEFSRHVATRADGGSVADSAAPAPATAKHLGFMGGAGGEVTKEALELELEREEEEAAAEMGADVDYLAKGAEFLCAPPMPAGAHGPAPLVRHALLSEAMARRHAAQTRLRADLDQL